MQQVTLVPHKQWHVTNLPKNFTYCTDIKTQVFVINFTSERESELLCYIVFLEFDVAFSNNRKMSI